MAIAPSPTRTAAAKDVAAALALIRKLKPRPSKRANADATHVIVTRDGSITGGRYRDAQVIVPLVFGAADEHRAIPFATLADAVKGYRGVVTLHDDCIAREDGAYFSFPSGADALDSWQGKLVTDSLADSIFSPDHSAIFAPSDFANLVNITTPHASADESRPVLTAVHVSADSDGTASWMATDSYRAVVAYSDFTPATPGSWSANIGATALRTIASVKPRGSVVVDTWDDAGIVRIFHGALTPCVYVRQESGQFPDVGKLVPDRPHAVTLSGDAIATALATWKRGDTAPAVLNIPANGCGGVLVLDKLAGLRDEAVRGTWRFGCDVTSAAEPVRIGVNAGFLRDCITSMPGDAVTIAYDTPRGPIVITAADHALPYDVRCVCMPVRIPA